MPQENARQEKGDIEYFVIAPDGKVYSNPYNLSIQNIKAFKKFQDMSYEGQFYRFAFDPETDRFYIQDKEWREGMNLGDEDAWDNALNPAIEFVKKKFGVKHPKKEFGDPANSATLNKLSNYNTAWDYLTEFLGREKLGTPNDAAVVEFFGDGSGEKISFHPDGFTHGNISTNSPTFAIDKSNFVSPDGSLDYAKINHQLIFSAFRNMEDEKARNNVDYETMYNPRKYNVFFAGYSKNGPEVRRADERQSERIQNEDTLRASLRTARCKECGEINNGAVTQCSKCGVSDFTYSPEYTGPLVLFSYIPERKQLIFQNHQPEEMEQYSQYRELLEKIKSTMSSVYGVPEKELVLSFDPSSYTPFVSMMSSYKIVWNYIVNIMCPKTGKKPRDITVVEAPVPMKGAIAVFLSNQSSEEERTEGGTEYRISQGISVSYPFIMIDVRIKNAGLRFGAMIHEYKHFLDIGDQTPERIPKYDNPDETFLAYIRHPDEQSAHYDQMFHALMMGMRPMDVLDMFAANGDLLHRAEYAKILDKAIVDYKEYKKKRGNAIKTAGSLSSPEIPVVMDWWYFEMQSGRMSELTKDLQKEEEETRDVGKDGLEALVSVHHDGQSGYLKPLEQLLQESRI
jgi:hypothetical protein